MSDKEPPTIEAGYRKEDGRTVPAPKYPRTFRVFGWTITDYGPPKMTARFITERAVLIAAVIGGVAIWNGSWWQTKPDTGFPPPLRPGDVMSGYRFVGSDPTDPAAWSKLPPPLDPAILDEIRRKYGNQ